MRVTPLLFRTLLLLAAYACVPVAPAASLLTTDGVNSMAKQVKAVIDTREDRDPLDRAARSAPAEVIATRRLEDVEARAEATKAADTTKTADAIPPTVAEVRAATSLLDAEPQVRNFHDKLRTLSAGPANALDLPANVRIYQGIVVNGFRRVVALLDQQGAPLCTGTMISPQYVLTATHCLCDRGTRTASPTRLKFVASGTDLDSANLVGELDPSKARWMGSGSICYGDLQDPDIAVVGFATQKALGVPPMALASDEAIDAAEALRIVGYGRGESEIVSSGTKRAALVPVVSANCTGEPATYPGREFSSVFECVKGREILAGRFGGSDTCDGDSGGPAFLAQVDSPDDVFQDDIPVTQLRIAAVTSRGIKQPAAPNAAGCGYGGIYVRISAPVRNFLQGFLPQ